MKTKRKSHNPKIMRNKDYGSLVIQAKNHCRDRSGKFIVWHNGVSWCAKEVLAEPLSEIDGMEYHHYNAATKQWVGGSHGF